MDPGMEDFIILIAVSAVYIAALLIFNASKPKKE